MDPHGRLDVRLVRHGRAAFDVLAAAIVTGQDGGPLAPVTVVTPSPAVAVTLRRRLGQHLGGLVGVEFADLGGVAEQLAASHLAAQGLVSGVDRELVTAGVRVALGARGGRLGAIGHHRATWEAIGSTITELASLDPAVRAALPTAGLVGELVALHDDVADHVPLGAGAAVLALASGLVRDGVVDTTALGPVVVHLPERPSPRALELLEALAAQTSVQVLLGSAGRSGDDAAMVQAFGRSMADVALAHGAPTAALQVVSANDLDDEVRSVVRRLLARAEAGIALEDMALVHPSGAPYARIVADVLREVGVPASVPSVDTLGQSAAGRVLVGLVDVADSGFARQTVVDLWASAVVVDEGGRLLPFARFDQTSRILGVRGNGAQAWHQAIEREVERMRARLDEGDDEGDGNRRAEAERRIEMASRLAAAVGCLEALVAAMPTEWSAVGTWVDGALDTLCGPVAERPGWPDHEIAADAAVRTAVGRLGALATVEPTPDAALVRATLRTVLDGPAPRRTRLGHGLFVTSLDRPPVVPLDTVAVVGLVEGQAPRVARDDVLLGEDVRRSAGLPTSEQRSQAQRIAFDATLASADHLRLLSFARNDQRSGRTQVPSRWLVDELRAETGVNVDTEELMAGAVVPGVEVVASFEASLAAVAGAPGVAALDAGERLLASLAGTDDPEQHPARALPTLAAAERTLRHRRAAAFTRFDGNLDGDGVDVTTLGVLSPTSLETYVECPRKWFFAKVLRLSEPERPDQIERIEPRTQGTLVHAVLERFFREAIEADDIPGPGLAWRPDQQARLSTIADEECDALEQRGLTGHPRWWSHDRERIHAVLRNTLRADQAFRAERGVVPVHVEFGFGIGDGAPPLEIPLDDGRVVLLRGKIDRVDLDGGRAVVWDYKYASPRTYQDVSRPVEAGGDPFVGGLRLQLAAYALAVREPLGVDRVEARYWFVKPGDEGTTHGYDLTDDLEERFRQVVDVIAQNIGAGRFPPRPGDYQWHNGDFASCAYCDFSRICPQDRDEEWERVRFDPSLRTYDRLVHEGSDTVTDAGEPR